MDRPPTTEEIERVRRYRCVTSGHTWDVIEQFGGPPVAIECVDCGERHKVEAG
jgi:predicted nucleic acid-binding Zn ribbon protein